MEQFTERTILGVIHRVDNQRCVAGHARLFGKTGPDGWIFYTYNQLNPEWALHRVWNFGLFAIHHIGEGKSCDPPGWHVTFASIRLSLAFRKADTYRTKRK